MVRQRLAKPPGLKALLGSNPGLSAKLLLPYIMVVCLILNQVV